MTGTWDFLSARPSPQEASSETVQAREAAFTELLGQPSKTVHPWKTAEKMPHVDLYIWDPGCRRGEPVVDGDYYTIATGGMSDAPMPGAPAQGALAELVAYAREINEEIVRYLSLMAAFPALMQRPLTECSTVASEAPYFSEGGFVATVFLPALAEPEMNLPALLGAGDERVHFLLPVPLTQGEHRFVVDNDASALLDRLDTVGYDLLLNPRPGHLRVNTRWTQIVMISSARRNP